MINKEDSDNKKGIPIGSKIPLDGITDAFGEEIQFKDLFKDFNGFNGILIDFFRGAFWVPCKEHLENINNNIEKFQQQKIKFMAISTDSVNHMRELSNQYNYKFIVISDRVAKITKQFNVYTFGRPIDIVYLKTKLAIPSTFLINNDLEVVWKYIGSREDRPSVALLLEKVDTYIIKFL